MRLRITLQLTRKTAIPINHQHLLTGVVYRFLERANADYASFLHEQGYPEIREPDEAAGGSPHRFKLFVFSPVRSTQRRVTPEHLWLGPGEAHWLVSSPLEPFLMNFASGLLADSALQVGSATLPIAQVETLSTPDFGETAHFICLSPVVVSVMARASDAGISPESQRRLPPDYLRPDDPRFSEGVRQNLLAKYSALYGRRPSDDRLTLAFDQSYLAQHKGTKVITYKEDIRILGAFCPFTLTGSSELIRLAWEAGVGGKNSGGFGKIEVAQSRTHKNIWI